MRLCSGAGCGRKIPEDAKYCDVCKAERGMRVGDGIRQHSKTQGYTEDLDAQRKSGRWQRTRDRALAKCPMCARCNTAVSVICDHIVPAEIAVQQARDSGRYPFDRWAGYYLPSNLQGLCRPCHGKKTDEDKAHVGPWPDAVAVEAAAPKKVWSF